MKHIAWIVTLAFLSVGVALWFAQNYSGQWEPRVRHELETRGSKALSSRLRIGEITLSILLKITAKDVEVWDTHQSPDVLLFRANQVTLTPSLFDLPRAVLHRNFVEAIGHITVDSPVLTLSSEWVRRFKTKDSRSKSPLWFGIEWNNGTFQFIEEHAPRGRWTLYQGNGHFRIRGPRTDLLAQGMMDHTEQVAVQITTLGKRWSAQGRVRGGQIPGVLELMEHLSQKKLLPEGWAPQGRFDLETKFSGRLPWTAQTPFIHSLREGQLKLIDTELQPGKETPPLKLLGSLSYQDNALNVADLRLQARSTVFELSGQAHPFTKPGRVDIQMASTKTRLEDLSSYLLSPSTATWLQGVGRVSVSLKGALSQPTVLIDADFPEGSWGRWPFYEAKLSARRAAGRWEIDPSRLRLWGGLLTIKGSHTPAQSDLQITGSEMALEAAIPQLQGKGLEGKLNFAMNSRGPADALVTTGSYWINGFTWVHTSSEAVRGEFEITRHHFKLQGSNEDQRIKWLGYGTKTAKGLTLEHASVQLRPGMSLEARGSLPFAQGPIKIQWNGKNIALADDVPMLHQRLPTLRGHADLSGTWEGTTLAPVIKLDLLSEDFAIGSSSTTRASSTLRWTTQERTLTWSHAGSALQGTWRATRGTANDWKMNLSMTTPQTKTHLSGQSFYDYNEKDKSLQTVRFQGGGTVQAANMSSWEIPWSFKGFFNPKENTGEMNLESSMVKVYGKNAEPAHAQFRWNNKHLQWDNFRWGQNLVSQGSLDFTASPAKVNADLNIQNLNTANWQKLFSPGIKEPVQGILNGKFALGGTLLEPHLQFTGQIAKAKWRAFRFDSRIDGIWKNAGFEPITVEGSLATGGKYRFQGRVTTSDRTAAGSLELTQFELQPVGESLSFPHPLEGKTSGTLSVNGPLDQLRLVGHLEGSDLQYGNKATAPLKLTSCITDLTLEPVPDQPQTTRLTFSKVLAKTTEEEIRLTPGSFVEFSGTKEARMQMGAEVRNVHLGVFTLFGGLDINGTWKIQPEGFALQGDILTRSLFINDYQLEQGHVQASYYNRVLTFVPPPQGKTLVIGTLDFKNSPQLEFKDFSLTGQNRERFQLSGSIGPEKWNFSMEGQGLDISTLGGLAGFPYKLNGSANVKIRGLGNLQNPDVQGSLEVHDGRALGLDFQSGSAVFAWQGSRMTFTRLQLSDPGRYSLTGTGIFPLVTKSHKATHDKTINFSLRLTDSNMGILQSITSEVKSARGALQGLLQITGTTDAPIMQGSLRVKNGDVVGAHYFRHVENFQLDASMEKDTLVINEFRGESGKGEFKGGGRITFAGFVPMAYDLHLEIPSSKGVEITVPELAIPESPLAKRFKFLTLASQCDVRGRATFRGSADSPVFFADALLTNGHFTFPPSSKNPPPPGFTQWMRRITWDTRLQFKDDAWFENELVEASLIGDLSIKGPSQKLRVDGGMDITKGQISYLGVQFDIQQARFEIHSNETDAGIVNTPYLRGLADSHVQTVDTLTGQGIDDTVSLLINYAPINEIKPILRSTLDPNLSQEKLLARVTQLEVENLTPQERTYLYQQQMVRLLDTSLATPLARNLLKRTGLVDTVRVSRVINPTAGNPLTDPTNPIAAQQQQQDTATNLLAGTKYTVAKNLSNRLSLGYGVRFEQGLNPDLTNKLDLRSDVEMSYRFLSNIYLRGTFDLPSQNTGLLPERKVTIEPHWRFGWWGNTNKEKKKPTPKATDTSNGQ